MPKNTGKEIEPAIEAGRLVVRNGGTLQALKDALVARPVIAPDQRTDMVPFPKVPEPIAITKEQKAALQALPEVFGLVQPSERRMLAGQETKALLDERVVLDEILGLLQSRKDAISTLVGLHFDVTAEDKGVAHPVAVTEGDETYEATPRDEHGAYILAAKGAPERTKIPETDKDWSREFRAGSQKFDTKVIDEMHEEGTLSHEAYLAMTNGGRRVFDENKAMLAAQKPEFQAEVLAAIRAATGYGKPSLSIWVRKTK